MGAVMGAIGGLSLGIALKNLAWAKFLTLAGAIGFSIGYVTYIQIIERQILGVPPFLVRCHCIAHSLSLAHLVSILVPTYLLTHRATHLIPTYGTTYPQTYRQ